VTRYRRGPLSPEEELLAAAAGVAAGLAATYVVRRLLGREPLPEESADERPGPDGRPQVDGRRGGTADGPR